MDIKTNFCKLNTYDRALMIKFFFKNKEILQIWKKINYDYKKFTDTLVENTIKLTGKSNKLSCRIEYIILKKINIRNDNVSKNIFTETLGNDKYEGKEINIVLLDKIINEINLKEKYKCDLKLALERENTKHLKVRELNIKNKELQAKNKVISKENSHLKFKIENEYNMIKQKNLKKTLSDNELLVQENKELKDQIVIMEQKLIFMEKRMFQEKSFTNDSVPQKEMCEYNVNKFENDFENQLNNIGDIEPRCSNCQYKCKRVLIVGGIEKMKTKYQQIIESKGFEFSYHSGNRAGKSTGLAEQMKWADVVICPVNVNSHNACLFVKKYCKKFNKNFHMISNCSATAINKTIEAIG